MQRWGNDEGANAVEFALVLPVLALLIFGIIQFGLVFLQTQGLEGASREGGRAASVGGSYQQIGDAIYDALSGLEGDLTITVSFTDAINSPADDTSESFTIASDGTFTPPAGGPCADEGDVEIVVADADVEIVIPLWGSETITYSATSTFRCESLA